MNVTTIPALPDARSALVVTMTGLGKRDLTLPADASTEPPLPVGEHWVTSGGASLDNGVIVYVHGGGFTHRNPPLMNLLAERISAATRRPALVVHYPLAPADPYPAPLDSVVAQYRALLPHIPAGKIVFFSESSGAALALSAMLRLGVHEKPAGVITVSAVTDLSLRSPSIDANTATDAGVTRELLASFIGAYLSGAAADQAPQSPIFGDLREMPPLLMAVGGAEALLDDTLRFGEAAAAAGVETDINVYEGMPHAFSLSTLDADHPTGRTLLDRVGDWVGKRVA